MDGLSVDIDPVPYVHSDADGTERLHLMVEGAHCAACIGRIENGLRRHDGVVDARLNLTTRRLVVRWRKGAARAAELGGNVCVPPTDIPVGRFSVLADPQGAGFSVIQLKGPPA